MKRAIAAFLTLLGVLVLQVPTIFEWEAVQVAEAAPELSWNNAGGTNLARYVEQQPYSGTLCITIDDGFRWVYTDLWDTLAAINSDSGLVGTVGEMHVSVYINLRGENALDDPTKWNADGANVDPTDQMTPAMAQELASSGIIAVGGHGYKHGTFDPDGLIGAPFKVTGFRYGSPGNGSSDSTVYSEVTDCIRAMRDTLGLPNVDAFVTPGHRQTQYSAQLMAKLGIKACRAGTMQTVNLSENWPEAAVDGDGLPVNVVSGKVRELNRQNIDMMNFALTRAPAGHYMEAMLPFYNFHRLWIPHMNPATGGAPGDTVLTGQPIVGTEEARQDTSKAMAYHIAQHNGMGVWVWHEIHEASNQSLGLAGVGEVLRYCAGLCKNLVENRDGPRLQLLTLAEGAAKHADWEACLAGQTFDTFGNYMLRRDDWRSAKPWGTFSGLEPVWADSEWAYVDSAAAAGNALFGPHGEGGLFRHAGGTVAAPRPLILVFPVPPGASLQIGCLATADTFPIGGGPDSISTAKIAIEATFMRAVPDPTDTLLTWVRDVTTSTQHVSKESWPEDAAGSGAADGSGHSQQDWTGNTAAQRWSAVKMWGGFHWRDQWRIARNDASPTSWWFKNDTAANDESMRWRQFYTNEIVPADARIAVVKFRPIGFTTLSTDTICVSGITVLATP